MVIISAVPVSALELELGDIIRKASDGDPEYQYRLGLVFFQGETLHVLGSEDSKIAARQDYGKAYEWFLKSA